LFTGCSNGKLHALDERAKDVYNFVAHGNRVLDSVWLEVKDHSESQGILYITMCLKM
jgi:hypothetical protein